MSFFPAGWPQYGYGGADMQTGAASPMMGANAPSYGTDASTTSGFKLGWNAPTLQMGMQGVNTLGNLWGAWQSNKMAKDQLNFTKLIANANLNNQIKSYNTALEDRSRSRAAVEGQSAATAQSYIDQNRLSR